MTKIFGSNGIRGVINKDLTPEFVLDMGRAIGTYFGKRSKILISRDYRFGGEFLEKTIESGLLISGIKIFEAKPVPTPTLQFNIKTNNFDGGIMITASHNPYQFNGIKVLGSDGVEIDEKQNQEIEQIFFSKQFSKLQFDELKYNIKQQDKIVSTYVRAILLHINKQQIRKRKFKVLIDPINSVGAITSPLIAKYLNCEIYTINREADPLFPARLPEPNTETLLKTAKLVKSLNIDIAIAHDADADRSIFIDNKGGIHYGDRSGTLITKYLLEKYKNNSKVINKNKKIKIFTAVSSSILVEEVLKKQNIEVVWTPVGAPLISHLLLKEKGFCAFEDNGGFMFPMHQYVRDGGMTFALMLELLANTKLTSSELFNKLPNYYPIKTKIPIINNFNLIDIENKVLILFNSMKIIKIIRIDGLKVIGKDFWFLIRKSGTEPVIRIMVEAKNRNNAESITKKLKQILMGS